MIKYNFFILVDKKGVRENTNIFSFETIPQIWIQICSCLKRANTNTNTNIQNVICKYEYEYEYKYSSHTVPTVPTYYNLNQN